MIHNRLLRNPQAQAITLTQTYLFGPAMSLLTDRMRAWVIAWNNGGHRNATEAARQAGYSDHKGNARVHAHRLLQDPRIQAAIVEDQKARLIGLDADATATVKEIMTNPQAAPQARLKAAEMVYNRGGLGVTQVTEHNVNITMTQSEKLGKLRELANELGVDPKTLLGSIVDLDETDYQDVTESDEKVTNSIPGLEGLV